MQLLKEKARGPQSSTDMSAVAQSPNFHSLVTCNKHRAVERAPLQQPGVQLFPTSHHASRTTNCVSVSRLFSVAARWAAQHLTVMFCHRPVGSATLQSPTNKDAVSLLIGACKPSCQTCVVYPAHRTVLSPGCVWICSRSSSFRAA